MNNHVMLVGHVGAAPETRVFDTGTKLTSFSLAVKMLAGTQKERTVWFKVKAWGPVADRAEKYVTRGRELVVTGQLDIETYTAEGNIRKDKPVIRLTTFHLCGKKPEADTGETPVEAEAQPDAVAENTEKTSRKKSAA